MLRDSEAFYLPNLYTFQNGNAFLGSFRRLRFRVTPDKEGETPSLAALVWYGEYCLELSQVQGEASFPLTEEGREALLDWLEAEFIRFQAQNGEK